MTAPIPCDRYQQDLAELALGTLPGRDRADALAHVDSCARCAEEMEELSRAADMLLQVVPEAEPPAGFEVRLLERVAEPRPARSATRQRGVRARLRSTRARVVLGAAAATVALGGAGAGWALAGTTAAAPAPKPLVLQATFLSASGHAVGRVVASDGSPPWIVMVVQPGHLTGKVTCRLELSGGRWVTVGTFTLNEGYGSWSARLWVNVKALRGAELVSQHGGVVATATFPA